MSNNHPILGKLIDTTAQRDAIHIAIAPVVATERLAPGQHIGFAEPGSVEKVHGVGPYIGIVDPFLKGAVMPGERFYMCLYQQTVTGMRHEWSHPEFTSPSRKWLENLAVQAGRTYEQLLEAGREAAAGETMPWAGDDTASEVLNDNKDEFFTHFEIVTGQRVPPDHRESVYFRCAC